LSQINLGASIIHSSRIGTPAGPRPSLPNSVSVGTAVSLHIHMSPAYCVLIDECSLLLLCLQKLYVTQAEFSQIRMAMDKTDFEGNGPGVNLKLCSPIVYYY
jgi:hypothetical protein